MRTSRFRMARALSVAGLCLLAAACGSSTDSTPQLDTGTAEGIGSDVSTVMALSVDNFTGPDISSLLAAPALSALARAHGAVTAPSGPFPASGCGSPSSLTDTDGDGILDDAIITFLAADCTTIGGSGTTVVTGSIHVVDNGFGFSASYSSVKIAFTSSGSGSNFSITLNGTGALTGGASAATFGQTLAVVVKVGAQTANLSESWQLSFTPTTGSIVAGSPLPAGTFSVNGNFAYSSAGRNFAFTIATFTPVVYAPTCAGQPSPFTGGEVRAVLVGTSGSVYVRVVYGPNCNNETVVAVGTTA